MTIRQRGFTLLELIISVVISSILLAFMGVFVSGPVETYFAQSRRAALVDSADAGWAQMDRDIRNALPNSLRACATGRSRPSSCC